MIADLNNNVYVQIRKDGEGPLSVKDFNSGETSRYATFKHRPRQIQANLAFKVNGK